MKTLIKQKLRLLTLLLLLASPAAVQAQFTYVTNSGTITITGYTGSGGDVTIPSTITGRAVTSIGSYAFYLCTSLTNVIIPNSVTSIGGGAFYSCSSLTNAIIPNSVTSIGFHAFIFCTSLTNVTIPNSVTSIGYGAFVGCTCLTSITVEALNPFYCSVAGVVFNKSQNTLIQYPGGKAGSYTIHNSVTSIGDEAFNYCTNLTSVTIPNSVTDIGYGAFSSCSSLTSVTIPNSVNNITDGAFSYCTNLTSVTIGNSVTSIGGYAFGSCTSLTSVTIPNSVTDIGYQAFYYCNSLKSVYFKGNVPSLGLDAFYSDTLATVYYLPGTTGWSSTFGGRPTKLWNPLAQTSGTSFGVRTNRFGFNITGTSGLVIVVEACTNLSNPVWQPVSTNTLTDDSAYFSDPQWTNYPGRFYRLRSP